MLNFTKVHGNGNDFVVLENFDGRHSDEDLSRLARLLCRRNFSVGADGILVTEKASDGTADFVMRILNSDGSESEMCGNGARALARYALEKGLAGPSMRFMTLAGLMRAAVEPPYVELDMGELSLSDAVAGEKLSSHGLEFPFVFLMSPIPHCVLWVEDYEALDDSMKFKIGREVSHDFARFPSGCNVNFAQPSAVGEVKAVTYEMGVEDLTKSCGTGSVATAIALSLDEAGRKYAANVVSVRNPGGVNQVRLEFSADKAGKNASCRAWLRGRTAIVAEGLIHDDALFE